jgi:hypothetical protein
MNIKTKFNIISEKMEKMNEYSRSIMRFEGEDSIEGLQESGKIQGRLDMLKLFAELSNYDLATGDDTVK